MSNPRETIIPRPLGRALTLAASAARTAGANGTAVAAHDVSRLLVLLDITASATDAGDTLDVYVDVSPDNSTWLNAIHFTQQAGNGAACKQFAVLDTATAVTVTDVTSDAAAGAVRPGLFGAYVRARWAIADVGGDDASHTFSVTAYAQ